MRELVKEMQIWGKKSHFPPRWGVDPTVTWVSPSWEGGVDVRPLLVAGERGGSKCSVSWTKMSSSSVPYLMARPFKGFDEMERARVS